MIARFVSIDIARSFELVCSAIFILCLLSVGTIIRADTQRVIDYEYDGAGNIVRIASGRNFGPPDVTALQPAFIHKESSVLITAIGVNLHKAEVTTTTPGLSVVEVTHTAETEVQFTLSADSTAVIGPGFLTFTTRLGSDTETIAIADRTPVIATQPNPIALAPDGVGVTVKLIFDRPFTTDQTYDLAVSDSTIATVNKTTVTLTAGETEVTVTVTGLTLGNTTLEINQLSNFLALGIPVIVSDAKLPPGTYAFYAEPVGVAAYIKPSLSTTGLIVTRKPLGVAVYLQPSINTTGIFVTPQPLGVAAYLEPSLSTTGLFVIPQPLGTAYGTVVSQITPNTVSRGASETLTVEGFELNEVTAVTFDPLSGITQTGPFTVSPDGTQMSLPIAVAGTAPTGGQVMVLTTAVGDQLFSDGVLTIQ